MKIIIAPIWVVVRIKSLSVSVMIVIIIIKRLITGLKFISSTNFKKNLIDHFLLPI